MASTVIWYQLVDGKGLPYKGTGGAKARLPADHTFLADFLNQVKQEYADSHLQGIAPSDLKVFLDKVSLDAKQSPLSVRSKLSALDINDDTILHVVVPALQQGRMIELVYVCA